MNEVWKKPPVSLEIYQAMVGKEVGVSSWHLIDQSRINVYADVIEDQLRFLGRSLEIAAGAGVAADAILLDPGFGFAKETPEANLDLMARFVELAVLGRPFVVGTSRKRFIGSLTGREPDQRDVGTAATNVILRLRGAAVFRVHNVAFSKDALVFADAMIARSNDRDS